MVAIIEKRDLRDFDWLTTILAIAIACFALVLLSIVTIEPDERANFDDKRGIYAEGIAAGDIIRSERVAIVLPDGAQRWVRAAAEARARAATLWLPALGSTAGPNAAEATAALERLAAEAAADAPAKPAPARARAK